MCSPPNPAPSIGICQPSGSTSASTPIATNAPPSIPIVRADARLAAMSPAAVQQHPGAGNRTQVAARPENGSHHGACEQRGQQTDGESADGCLSEQQHSADAGCDEGREQPDEHPVRPHRWNGRNDGGQQTDDAGRDAGRARHRQGCRGFHGRPDVAQRRSGVGIELDRIGRVHRVLPWFGHAATLRPIAMRCQVLCIAESRRIVANSGGQTAPIVAGAKSADTCGAGGFVLLRSRRRLIVPLLSLVLLLAQLGMQAHAYSHLKSDPDGLPGSTTQLCGQCASSAPLLSMASGSLCIRVPPVPQAQRAAPASIDCTVHRLPHPAFRSRAPPHLL